MAQAIENIRNVVLVGHGSSGKTSLADKMLVMSGAITGTPSTDNGTSYCDHDEEEKVHKHSIEPAIIHFQHEGRQFNVIDCPGYPDFIGQTISALRAVETAAIFIDAHTGIKVNTRRVWSEAEKEGLGRVIVISKMDLDNINVQELLNSIQEVFGDQCIPVNLPVGQGADFRGVISTLSPPNDVSGVSVDVKAISTRLVDTIVEVDDVVMEKYFEGQMPSADQIDHLCETAIAMGKLVPILFISTRTGHGVKELLDFLGHSALSPFDLIRKAKTTDGQEVEIKPDREGPLVGQVFRTRIDPFVQKLNYVRIFSGTLKKDSQIHASTSRKGIKVTQLLSVQGHETKAVDSAGPGEIIAIAKAEDLHTGSSIGDMVLDKMSYPRPMVGLAITPKTRGDEGKLSTCLHKLIEEDPTLILDHDPETKEMVLTGISELHLQLLRERLKRRDKVEVETKEPKIPYRETVQADAEGSYRHRKQSGGSGQFGEVHIRMYPFPEGTDPEAFATKAKFPQLKDKHFHPINNFLWVDSVVGGSIPGNFMPAIEKGFLERIKSGVIAGFPVQNICVEVFFGKDHPVDSNETAFRIAGSRAFAEVFKKSKPSLLEPVVNLHITVPAGNVGDVSSDLSGRRGQMLGMQSAGGGMTTVEARCPLSEVMTYARTLSSMTGGQGSYTMEFSHYDTVPNNKAQEVIAQAKKSVEEDE